MSSSAAAIPSLDEYQLRLPNFEGPLDVLLRLIERDQLEISELSLLAVFDQFMAYMHALDAPPPAVIAEFVAVAGRMSVLKSRALLPKPPRAIEEAAEPDLVRQLEEYRAVKAAAELLAGRQQQGAGAFGRGESIAFPEPSPMQISPQPSTSLAQAVSRWLTRIPAKPVPLAPLRVVSLWEMISRITSALGANRQVSFGQIRDGCGSRQEVAVAFLALLLLLRRQTIRATQHERFGAIILARSETNAATMAQPAPLVRYGSNGHG
ncbi:MAG: segregation and condensation protein A [Thermomicrobiales bacterium]